MLGLQIWKLRIQEVNKVIVCHRESKGWSQALNPSRLAVKAGLSSLAYADSFGSPWKGIMGGGSTVYEFLFFLYG